MRRVGTVAFLVISGIALAVLFNIPRPFNPGVNLPEVDAGKPFTRWDGVVITRLPDGKFLLDGRLVGSIEATESIRNALKRREHVFTTLHSKLPRDCRRNAASVVPLLVCMDENASTKDFFNTLVILFQGNSGNIHVAVRDGEQYRALSACIHHAMGMDGFYVWHDEVFELSEKREAFGNKPRGPVKTVQIWAEVSREGKYCFYTMQGPPIPSVRLSEFSVDYPHASIEPMFGLIMEHEGKETVVMLDLFKYARNLSYAWFVRLLGRLEKAPIKAYLFSTMD